MEPWVGRAWLALPVQPSIQHQRGRCFVQRGPGELAWKWLARAVAAAGAAQVPFRQLLKQCIGGGTQRVKWSKPQSLESGDYTGHSAVTTKLEHGTREG